MAREIRIPILTRVEGEGALSITLDHQEVRDVKLAIYEPPRLFESLLRGRALEEVPDITARICGICPVAYQITAAEALERALDITTSPHIQSLRRLLYCGEWIESHVLHIHLLHAPDFFGCVSGIELAARFPEEVNRGLRMKKAGNRLLEVLGGRAIHPINVAVGGFYRAPDPEQLARLISEFEICLQLACDTVHWIATFQFPDFTCDHSFVSLIDEAMYPIIQGQVGSSDGLLIEMSAYESCFREVQVPHSTALQSQRVDQSTNQNYFVGPLARLFLNHDRLSPRARQMMAELDWPANSQNPQHGIMARGLEVVTAFEEALQLLQAYNPALPVRERYRSRPGEGCWATEAPRGLIYHRYAVDEEGRIASAKIVPPTSQNQAQIESDLRVLLPSLIDLGDSEIANHCERLVRAYDPCISCSTHWLKVDIVRLEKQNISNQS